MSLLALETYSFSFSLPPSLSMWYVLICLMYSQLMTLRDKLLSDGKAPDAIIYNVLVRN